MVGGWHYPYTRTVHVNALTSEKMHTHGGGGVMRILAHELRHRADSTNRKAVTAVEIAARWASYKAGFEVSELLPLLTAAPLLGGVATRQFYYNFEPAEKRARIAEEQIETSPHQTDIVFPDTARAQILKSTGQLPEDAMKQFGFQDPYRVDDVWLPGQVSTIGRPFDF